MKTRQDYMQGRCSHREYYAQFVTQRIIDIVKDRIGLKAITDSRSESFNDIPLQRWDDLQGSLNSGELHRLMGEVGDFYSLCACVCIAKEAAKQIKESTN